MRKLALLNTVAISLTLVFFVASTIFSFTLPNWQDSNKLIAFSIFAIIFTIMFILYLTISIKLKKNVKLNGWIKTASWINIISIALIIILLIFIFTLVRIEASKCYGADGSGIECGWSITGFLLVWIASYISFSIIYLVTFVLFFIGYEKIRNMKIK